MKYYERRGSITVGPIDSSIRSSEREIPDKTDAFKSQGPDCIEHNQIQSPVTENDFSSGDRRIFSGADQIDHDVMIRDISPAVSDKNTTVKKSNLESNQSSMASTYDSALINWMNESSEFDGDNSSINEDRSSFHNSCSQSVSSIQSITSHRLYLGSSLSINSIERTISMEDVNSQQNIDAVNTEEIPNIQEESNKSKHNSSNFTFSPTTHNKRDSQNKSLNKDISITNSQGNAKKTSCSNETNFISQVESSEGMDKPSNPVEIENSVHDVPRDLVEVSLSHSPDELNHQAIETNKKEIFQSIISCKESKNDRMARKGMY